MGGDREERMSVESQQKPSPIQLTRQLTVSRQSADNATGPPQAPPGVFESSDSVSPSARKHHNASKNRQLQEDFDRVWSAYPRKVGKKKALEVYRKLAPNAPLADRILSSVLTQNGALTRRGLD